MMSSMQVSSTPSTGSDVVNKTYSDWRVGGRPLVATSPSPGQFLTYDGTNGQTLRRPPALFWQGHERR